MSNSQVWKSVRRKKVVVGARQMRRRIQSSLATSMSAVTNLQTHHPHSKERNIDAYPEVSQAIIEEGFEHLENHAEKVSGITNGICHSGKTQVIPDSSDEFEDSSSLEDTRSDSSSDVASDQDDTKSFQWDDIDSEGNESTGIGQNSNEFEAKVKQSLIEWVMECNTPRNHATNLLKRLHRDARLTFLPLDSRTLLSSRRGKLPVQEMPPGKYFHFGVSPSLRNLLLAMKSSGAPIPMELKLFFNVDGLPLSNSSCSDFWPILFKVLGRKEVFVAGIYHGSKKPEDVNIYLRDFCEDILKLINRGIQLFGQTIRVTLSGFSSDAPATTYVLNIKTHNAYFGCRKCNTRGTWVQNAITHYTQAKTAGRVTFPELDAPLRTDQSFRDRLQRKHHDGNGCRSIVEDIIGDLIGDVTLDYMHLVCIGVHKKGLGEWISGKFDKCRLSKDVIRAMSAYRVGIKKFVPDNFVRKTRPMEDLPRWKATELRLDLLYICPVYKQFLPMEMYHNLMLLHVSIKLLVNEETCRIHADYAGKLLKLYVTSSSKLYGPQFITFNVHSLIHLPKDVLKHGSLDNFSTFPFENKLQKVKNLQRKSGKPLQQVVRRLEEIQLANCENVGLKTPRLHLTVEGLHYSGPVLPNWTHFEQYRKLYFKGSFLTVVSPNNCVFLENNDIFVIKNFIKSGEEILVVGQKYEEKNDMYLYPLPSSRLNEFLIVSRLSTHLESFSVSKIKWKACHLPNLIPPNGSFFVSPLFNHD